MNPISPNTLPLSRLPIEQERCAMLPSPSVPEAFTCILLLHSTTAPGSNSNVVGWRSIKNQILRKMSACMHMGTIFNTRTHEELFSEFKREKDYSLALEAVWRKS
ncbi:UNVERIFIED_CONTAM: hypothetical protein K2H54_049150 [Gekko kuhli]